MLQRVLAKLKSICYNPLRYIATFKKFKFIFVR